MRTQLILLITLTLFPAVSSANTMTKRVAAAAQSGKYTYVMFYHANDAATQQMAGTIQSHVKQTAGKTDYVAVNVRDRAEAQLVARFDASRIPLPAVFGLAPNGAVTGVYRQKVNQAQLNDAILTPMYSGMVKALQSQQVVVACMVPDANTPVPTGVTALQQDPLFTKLVYTVKVPATDGAEADFFRRMQVNRNLTAPVVLMFAPPGTHLGNFGPTVSGQELAQTLHKSGKCNCSKCQTNR